MRQEEKSLEELLVEQTKEFFERLFPSLLVEPQEEEATIIFLINLLGIPQKMWHENPSLAQQKIHHLIGQLAEVLGFIFSSDASQMILARQRIRQLSKHLAAANLHFDSTQLERLLSQLRRSYLAASDKQPFTHIVAQLQAFAQKPPSQKQTLMAQLQELIESLRVPQEPKVSYYERGRQVVRDNLRVPKFDVKEILAAHQRTKKS